MILKYSAQSKKDIQDIARYIADDNVNAAHRFLDAIEETYSMLSTFPRMGDPPTFDFIDEMQTVAVNSCQEYAIFYRLLGDVVRIDRVAHGKRDLPNLFKLDHD